MLDAKTTSDPDAPTSGGDESRANSDSLSPSDSQVAESIDSEVPVGGALQFPNDSNAIPRGTVEASLADGTQLTGQGVGIGIVADSFDASPFSRATAERPKLFNNLADDIAAGELPEGVDIIEDSAFGDDTDEGRAMAQIIYDIAPDASLFFQTSNPSKDLPNSDAEIASAYDTLVETGQVDIIVDDVSDPFAPIYQQSLEAQAQDRAVEAGISVFDAAGNFGLEAVEVEFSGTPGQFVDFDPETEGVQGITGRLVEGQVKPSVSLFWDDPYTSQAYTEALPPEVERPQATADFDLYFVPRDTDLSGFDLNGDGAIDEGQLREFQEIAIARSEKNQFASSGQIDPFESIGNEEIPPVSEIAPDDGFVRGQWVALLFGGDGEDRRVTLRANNETTEVRNPLSFDDDFNQIRRQAAATSFSTSQKANVVGQVNANTNGITPDSALGSRQILFDNNGQRLAPEDSFVAPIDFLGPSGIETTVPLNRDLSAETEPLAEEAFTFFGTSAAAPSVAASAALLLQANPDLSPERVSELLADTADGRTEPVLGSRRTGTGLINVQEAVDKLEASEFQSRRPRTNERTSRTNDRPSRRTERSVETNDRADRDNVRTTRAN